MLNATAQENNTAGPTKRSEEVQDRTAGQSGPLSLVEEWRGSSLIGRELP